MARFRPGIRVKYRDGVIYRVAANGSYRREDGGKTGKAERKAAKKERRLEKARRLKTCATRGT